MKPLVEPLGLTMPMAAFNGGSIVLPDLSDRDVERLSINTLPEGSIRGAFYEYPERGSH